MLKQGTAIERRDSALAERETLQKNIVREKEALSRALIVGEGAEERARLAETESRLRDLDLMIDGNGSADSGLKGEAEKEIRQTLLVEQARSFERMREHSATELELRAKMKASEDAFVRDRKAWEAHRRTSPGTFTANLNLERHRAAHPWIVENEVPQHA